MCLSAPGSGRGYPIGEESLLADPDSCPADGDHFTHCHCICRALLADSDGEANQAAAPRCADRWGGNIAQTGAPSPVDWPIEMAVRSPVASPNSGPTRL